MSHRSYSRSSKRFRPSHCLPDHGGHSERDAREELRGNRSPYDRRQERFSHQGGSRQRSISTYERESRHDRSVSGIRRPSILDRLGAKVNEPDNNPREVDAETSTTRSETIRQAKPREAISHQEEIQTRQSRIVVLDTQETPVITVQNTIACAAAEAMQDSEQHSIEEAGDIASSSVIPREGVEMKNARNVGQQDEMPSPAESSPPHDDVATSDRHAILSDSEEDDIHPRRLLGAHSRPTSNSVKSLYGGQIQVNEQEDERMDMREEVPERSVPAGVVEHEVKDEGYGAHHARRDEDSGGTSAERHAAGNGAKAHGTSTRSRSRVSMSSNAEAEEITACAERHQQAECEFGSSVLASGTDVAKAEHLAKDADKSHSAIPTPWIACQSRSSGQTYYYNTVTEQTTWNLPVSDMSQTDQDRGEAASTAGKRARQESEDIVPAGSPRKWRKTAEESQGQASSSRSTNIQPLSARSDGQYLSPRRHQSFTPSTGFQNRSQWPAQSFPARPYMPPQLPFHHHYPPALGTAYGGQRYRRSHTIYPNVQRYWPTSGQYRARPAPPEMYRAHGWGYGKDGEYELPYGMYRREGKQIVRNRMDERGRGAPTEYDARFLTARGVSEDASRSIERPEEITVNNPAESKHPSHQIHTPPLAATPPHVTTYPNYATPPPQCDAHLASMNPQAHLTEQPNYERHKMIHNVIKYLPSRLLSPNSRKQLVNTAYDYTDDKPGPCWIGDDGYLRCGRELLKRGRTGSW